MKNICQSHRQIQQYLMRLSNWPVNWKKILVNSKKKMKNLAKNWIRHLLQVRRTPWKYKWLRTTTVFNRTRLKNSRKSFSVVEGLSFKILISSKNLRCWCNEMSPGGIWDLMKPEHSWPFWWDRVVYRLSITSLNDTQSA